MKGIRGLPDGLAALALAVAGLGCEGGSDRGGGSAAETAAALTDSVSDLVVPRLVDVTDSAGIDFRHENGAAGDKWMPETLGSGGAWLDYDGDGRPDLFLVNGRAWRGTGAGDARAALYRNLGDGTFEDVGASTGADVIAYGMGAVVGDYDADGDPDIYVTALGPNLLLRNEGGTFVEVAGELAVTGDPEGRPDAWSTGAAWLDYDVDGDLDLFVCNYVRWTPATDVFHTLDGTTKAYATPEPYEGDTCVLYANEGPGRPFRDVTRETGVWDPTGKALGVVVDDLDDDGLPDIFVANDTEPNRLYHNLGGRFEEIGVRAGVGFDPTGRARAGMGVGITDLSGDGRIAVAIGNFSRESVSLYAQTEPDLFRDVAPAMRLSRPTRLPLTFGLRFADMNLDGAEDLLLANGHIEPTIGDVRSGVTFEQPAQLFLRSGEAFVETTERTGDALGRPIVGRGLATADYDGDGDPDILLTENGGRARLLRNDLSPTVRGLRVRLDGGIVGAKVRVFSGERMQRWYVTGSGSYLTQSEIDRRSFGLGSATGADSVIVAWPDGTTETRRTGLEAGSVAVFARGEAGS